MIERPTNTEYAPFFTSYVSLVPEEDILAVLEHQPSELTRLVAAVPSDRETYRYAHGKWSIREVAGHITDAERVFGHRAFCISRGDQASFPGFDEQDYVAASGFDSRSLDDLAREFAIVRQGNLAALRRLDDTAWRRVGTANNNTVSVRALAYIMAGHFRHHLGILNSRYGVAPAA